MTEVKKDTDVGGTEYTATERPIEWDRALRDLLCESFEKITEADSETKEAALLDRLARIAGVADREIYGEDIEDQIAFLMGTIYCNVEEDPDAVPTLCHRLFEFVHGEGSGIGFHASVIVELIKDVIALACSGELPSMDVVQLFEQLSNGTYDDTVPDQIDLSMLDERPILSTARSSEAKLVKVDIDGLIENIMQRVYARHLDPACVWQALTELLIQHGRAMIDDPFRTQINTERFASQRRAVKC